MRKFLTFHGCLIFSLILLIGSVDVAAQVPTTPVPEISTTVDDGTVTVWATGIGEIHLFCDYVEVPNPYPITRTQEDQYYTFTAYAQDAGFGPSDWATLDVIVPSIEGDDPDDPHNYGAWMVLYDKYGNKIWKELAEYYYYSYMLSDDLSLDLETYSVIDYYTETPPYKDVLCYFMIDGVRYGPETPNLNPTTGAMQHDDWESGYAYFQPMSPDNENCFAFPAGFDNHYLRVEQDYENGTGYRVVIGYRIGTGTGASVYDGWTNVVLTDKYGNNVEYRLSENVEVDLDQERFGSAICDGYVPFHFTHYYKDTPYSTPKIDYSRGAETDGTVAVLGVPYAQVYKKGSNNFLLQAGHIYRLGMFEGYLYALELGPVQSGEITVNMPTGTNMSDYVAMQLVLTTTEGSRRQEITIGNQLSYVFRYLPRGKTWNISLVNEYGDIFGKIENITLGDENVSVTFDNLLKAYTVSLTILHPSGTDITDMASIYWQEMDYDYWDYMSKESSVQRMPLGKKLICSFDLPDDIYSTCIVPDSYLNHTVNEENNDIVIQLLPNSDNPGLSCTDETTSFTVDKSNVLIDNYITFRAQVGFKEEYADKVSDVKWIVDMPESCTLYENSVMVGDEIGNYTVNNNQITIPLSSISDVVRFCAVPSEEGKYAANAYLQFALNGETMMIPVGSARFSVINISLIVPQLTSNKSIVVRGAASRGKTVKVYDGAVQIAQTNCLANGSWHVTCDLDP